VSHHGEPAGKVVEALAEADIEDATIRLKKSTEDADISKSHTLTNKVGAVEEVLVEDSHGLAHVTLGLLAGSGTGRDVEDERKNPSGSRDLDLFAELHPLIDKNLLSLSLAKKISAASKILSSSTSGEDGHITVLKKRALAHGVILRVKSSLLNLNTGVLCSNKSTKSKTATFNDRKLRHYYILLLIKKIQKNSQ